VIIGSVTTLVSTGYIYGLALSPTGTLYAAGDYQIYSISTGLSTTSTLLAGSCCGSTDGLGSNAKFSDLQQIAVSVDGNTIYAVDDGYCIVRAVTTSGNTYIIVLFFVPVM
jgi:DNA-binding beta-propeller fold protein YncE